MGIWRNDIRGYLRNEFVKKDDAVVELGALVAIEKELENFTSANQKQVSYCWFCLLKV